MIIAVLGLAVDVGRLYVSKSELQTYSDFAAVAGAYALDGIAQGITNAKRAVQNLPGTPSGSNRWTFATQSVSGAQFAFSSSSSGPFVASPGSPAGVQFVQVAVSESVPVHFLPILPGVGTSVPVTAKSLAGQIAQTSLGDGLAPFSPDAHNVTDPNFGFTVGQQYTLRWPPNGVGKKSCGGDAGYSAAGSSDRGYVDVGQGSGNSSLVSTIVDNNFFLSSPLSVGSTISMLTGQGSVSSAIQTRFNEDTDTTASSFSSYVGNGRRVLIVPVNDGSATPTIVGFAAFFLPSNPCGNGNTDPCCGEYIGAALQFCKSRGSSDAGRSL